MTSESKSVPLFVDLDETLVRTDTLCESALRYCKLEPLNFVKLLSWLLNGKAGFKQQLAKEIQLDPASLPYSHELLSFLQAEHSRGRVLHLATASDQQAAEPIAAHLGIFTNVLGSNGFKNLRGEAKLAAIRDALPDGAKEFAYAGDSAADIPIWQAATERYLVNATPAWRSMLERSVSFTRQFDPRSPDFSTYARALRVQQWLKNGLIFLPLLLAHEYGDLSKLWAVLLAAISFSLCASGVYVMNDLLDLDADRKHHEKRSRPFAANELSLTFGLSLVPKLFGASFLLALFGNWHVIFPLFYYLLLTTAYSLWVKRILVADVILLSCLYTLRVIAGGIAAPVIISEWMLTFSIFAFLSLALGKRYAELKNSPPGEAVAVHGRGYVSTDLAQVGTVGCASGVISILVLSLYINSDSVKHLYTYPGALWLLCPLLLYWMTRFWILAGRGLITEDPLVAATKDKISYAVGLLAVIFILLAR